jgi:hypothetical protein
MDVACTSYAHVHHDFMAMNIHGPSWPSIVVVPPSTARQEGLLLLGLFLHFLNGKTFDAFHIIYDGSNAKEPDSPGGRLCFSFSAFSGSSSARV